MEGEEADGPDGADPAAAEPRQSRTALLLLRLTTPVRPRDGKIPLIGRVLVATVAGALLLSAAAALASTVGDAAPQAHAPQKSGSSDDAAAADASFPPLPPATDDGTGTATPTDDGSSVKPSPPISPLTAQTSASSKLTGSVESPATPGLPRVVPVTAPAGKTSVPTSAPAQVTAPVPAAPVPSPGPAATGPTPVSLPDATGPVVGFGDLCVDDLDGNTADLAPVDLYACNGSAAQQWSWVQSSRTLQVFGRCLDVYNGGPANGTVVEMFQCNGSSAQVFIPRSDGSLYNLSSGRCLDDPDSATQSRTPLQVWDCNGGANQRWTMP
jgi:hypothetical protein